MKFPAFLNLVGALGRKKTEHVMSGIIGFHNTEYQDNGLRGCDGVFLVKKKGKVHLCTGTEALYRPYGP